MRTQRYFENFNSIKVRLEQAKGRLILLAKHDFNSIKVRLEPNRLSSELKNILFQFHKGTIRTQDAFVDYYNVPAFQFHKGTIRTFTSVTTSSARTTFQFHKGTIRTQANVELKKLDLNFNSIKVRLERFRSKLAGAKYVISIP